MPSNGNKSDGDATHTTTGFGPLTEILLEKDHGLILVGPFPPEIQNYTSYTACR
jgi:hypothetical protein